MNWYFKLKIAQIWDVESSYSFEDKLKNIYELEYKYNMLRTRPFKGLDRRKENILSHLENKLNDIIERVKDPILEVFKNWLETHALTDPRKWAEERCKMSGEVGLSISEIMDSLIYEKARYSDVNSENAERVLLQEASNNIEQYPSLKQLLYVYNKDYIMNEKEEIENYDINEINEMYGQNFSTREEALKWIEESFSLDILDLGSSVSEIIENYMNDILSEMFIIELYQNQVFPYWYRYWKERGIDETRASIEYIYKGLKRSEDINDKIKYINLALNAYHQGGSMLENLCEYLGIDDRELEEALTELSAGKDVEKWNSELREIGVEI